MIYFRDIPSNDLENHLKELDETIVYIDSEFGIELKSYGNILRIGLNAIQAETIENLCERLKINQELEKELDNAGGYTLEYIKDNNPKKKLSETLNYLKENLPKQEILLHHLNNEIRKETFAVFDNNDLDYVSRHISNTKVRVISFSDLKRLDVKNKNLVCHSFNGQKDFDYLYNLESNVMLVVYQQEKNLFQKCLENRKKLIESEVQSEDRLAICKIEYKKVATNTFTISSTIKAIVSRLDEMNKKAYDGYKEECDLLLNEIEEKLIYKITSNRELLYLESNDTVFTDRGDLLKVYKIKEGDKIRIYPKEELAENLYQVAVENEPEVFGIVEEHANFWKEIISELRNQFGDDQLFQKLKEKGLKVLPATLATYGKGVRKFPMYKNDLRAIFRLFYRNKNENEIDAILQPIFKSKTTYNSTMIVLGRGLKQELRLFLKEGKIGDILQNRNFNEKTLEIFVDEFMPIQNIITKEPYTQNIETLETNFLEQIEL